MVDTLITNRDYRPVAKSDSKELMIVLKVHRKLGSNCRNNCVQQNVLPAPDDIYQNKDKILTPMKYTVTYLHYKVSGKMCQHRGDKYDNKELDYAF